MNTDLMNVDAFANETPDAAFASLNPADESLADGIGSSYGIIGYRGKVWTLRLRGETHTLTRADDGSPSAFLDCIVLRSASHKSKSYYPAGSFDQDNTGTRPTCSALDGVTPDSDIAEPQSSACAICPRNEWKMDDKGRKGRDCADYKRLAVLLLPSVSNTLLGAPLMEPVFLRVPAASLNDLAVLGEAMKQKGFHYSTYITRIGFVADKAHPQMTFRALQKLSGAEAAIVMPMREDANAYRITGESEVGKQKMLGSTSGVKQVAQTTSATASASGSTQAAVAKTPSTSPAQATASAPTKSETTTVAGSSPVDDEEAALEKKLAEMKAKKLAAAEAAAKAAQAKPAEPEKVDAGFGTLITPSGEQHAVSGTASVVGAPSTSMAATNTVEDTGEPEDADADLNARVAALVNQ